MCGIAGIMTVNGQEPSAAALNALSEAMVHRGPDGEGRYDAGNTGMVQRRLAIIDLETGDQPIGEPGGISLIANGEIYNYRELTAAMDDVHMATRSDCEPPLHLYCLYGLDYADHLRGMYAIAIHDPKSDRLVLSRDPFGIKPLYYVEAPECFAFASEPQALLRAGLAERTVEPAVRVELLQLQFATGRETVFRDVKRLLPGETIVVSQGRVVERRRRPALPDGGPQTVGVDEAMAALDRELEETVQFHQRSDVPYGMFLSGGVDSTALLAVMAKLNDRPVQAFTAGFGELSVPDERAHAKAMARAVGADYREVVVTDADFWRELPDIVGAFDDPCADYAIIPSYMLARAAAAEGLKVILVGEGGDEIFAGYGRYRSALRPWWRGGRRMRARGILDRVGVLREPAAAWRDGIVASESVAARPERSRLQVAQAVDCADWLSNDLLTKLDRSLMAHSVEGRTPFLDVPFAEFAFRLPDNLKIRQRRGKWLLRRWLAERLPVAEPFARKRGFTVPVIAWIGRADGGLAELVADQPAIGELCDPAAVRKLFVTNSKAAGFACWALLFYAVWHARHVKQVPAGGGVLETLAQARSR